MIPIAPSSLVGRTGSLMGCAGQNEAAREIVPLKRIPDQISEAHEAVSALLDAVERISTRVSSIADGAPPEAIAEATTKMDAPEPECVANLQSLIWRIQLATARAHSIADRVRL